MKSYKRLTSKEKEEIIAIYCDGEASESLADLYDVSNTTIKNIVKNAGVARKRRQYDYDDTAFDIVTEKSAYWVGFIIADGYVTDDFKWHVKLQTKDQDHLEKLKTFLKTEKPLYYEEHLGNIMGQNNGALKQYSSVRLTIASQQMVRALKGFGIVPRKTTKERVIGLENNRHFWRGVIDGDGSFGLRGKLKNPGITLVGSFDLLTQFGDFIEKITGCDLLPHAKVDSKAYYLETQGWKTVPIILEALYGNTNIFLDRKFKIYQEIIDKYHERENGNFVKRKGSHKLDSYQIERLKEELQEGKAKKYLAEKYHITEEAVYYHSSRLNLQEVSANVK